MKNKKSKLKKKKRIICLFLLILVLIYVFLFSSLFKIRKIEVSESREVSEQQIKDNFSFKNIFLFTKKKIKEDLIKKIPLIADLEIKKDIFAGKIKLKIQERDRLGIVCQEESCFYIDSLGFLFEDAPQTSGSLILLIKDFTEREFFIGKKIFEENQIGSISFIKENLFLETGIKVLDFNILFFPLTELKVVTNEGWYILFDLERDIQKQLLSLKAVLKEKIQEREGLEYIDLRIENRVYYK